MNEPLASQSPASCNSCCRIARYASLCDCDDSAFGAAVEEEEVVAADADADAASCFLLCFDCFDLDGREEEGDGAVVSTGVAVAEK